MNGQSTKPDFMKALIGLSPSRGTLGNSRASKLPLKKCFYDRAAPIITTVHAAAAPLALLF